jgi:DNA polymerase-1
MIAGKLFLLDAMALLYKAHFVFVNNPRITAKGVNTSGAFGFTNTLLEVLEKEKPTHMAVAFESTVPTFREHLYTDYKANRQEAPEELVAAIPMIQNILKGFQIPAISAEGYEADDVIGTLAVQAAAQGFQVFLMTPDKDYAQLVRENIFLYRPGQRDKPTEVLDRKGVIEKFGVPPEKITDFLGLKGDSVDNIPGIPKVGDKTALELLNQFGSLEAIIAQADKISKKAIKESIQTHAKQGLFSKELATIATDVPIRFNAADFLIQQPDITYLNEVFLELEFKTLARRVTGVVPGVQSTLFQEPGMESRFSNAAAANDSHTGLTANYGSAQETPKLKTIRDTNANYKLIRTEAECIELAKMLQQSGSFAFDTETDSLDPLTANLVGMSFSNQANTGWYVACPSEFKETTSLVMAFADIFADEKIEKIGQNIKFDMAVLMRYGIVFKGTFFDTMLAHYVINSDGRHNMDDLARAYLNYSPISIETLIGPKGKKQKSMREVPVELVAEYAAEDADITFQLKAPLVANMQKAAVENVFQQLEMPLVPVLLAMESRGIAIDSAALAEYSIELEKQMKILENQIYQSAGQTFNLNSPRQLGEILFEKLKLGTGKKTATGQYSTDEEILVQLAAEHQIAAQIIEFRQLAKLKSTYVDALPGLVNPKTKRLHTHFNQALAVTGRLSSNNPNLQNIPIRTEQGKEVRKAFIPGYDDWVLLSADYSQIELRIMADRSEDPALIDAFKNGEDIHTATAAKVFGVPPGEVTSDMRRKAKTINFGIIYGITGFGLAQRLGIKKTEAGEIIQAYFEKYPNVRKYMDEQIHLARKQGFVRTISGRIRYLRDINSRNPTVRGFAERNAINAPIQGTAADMIKLAMIRIACRMQAEKLQANMLLQVHDELLFETPVEELPKLTTIVIEGMRDAMPLRVPVEVSVGTGKNWLDAH